MGKIDIALNRYFGNEECADFINAVSYNGERVVKPEDFVEKDPVLAHMYEVNGKTDGFKRERDFFRMVLVNNTYYIFIGVEHQSKEDPIMPLNMVTGSDFKIKEGEVKLSMCDALRDIREEGRSEGREEGRSEGRLEELLSSIKKLIKNLHITPDQAMDILQVSQEERNLFMKSLG